MIIYDQQETLDLGRSLAAVLRPGDKIALHGTLGAGKTSLARGILLGLGYKDEVPSPTFAIVQQYSPPETSLPVAHVDLYRIEDMAELDELGLDEILFDGALIVEWPDRMPDEYWHDALQITLNIISDTVRQLTYVAGDAWKDRWPQI